MEASKPSASSEIIMFHVRVPFGAKPRLKRRNIEKPRAPEITAVIVEYYSIDPRASKATCLRFAPACGTDTDEILEIVIVDTVAKIITGYVPNGELQIPNRCQFNFSLTAVKLSCVANLQDSVVDEGEHRFTVKSKSKGLQLMKGRTAGMEDCVVVSALDALAISNVDCLWERQQTVNSGAQDELCIENKATS
ncbi:hypothetical protein B0H19DRAFT_1074315 [Mycena capillaripes]|nr:hypothetical protein B0H19DRAFT_1074315 [Mycena capillaripes]